jgi:hypothetical protein
MSGVIAGIGILIIMFGVLLASSRWVAGGIVLILLGLLLFVECVSIAVREDGFYFLHSSRIDLWSGVNGFEKGKSAEIYFILYIFTNMYLSFLRGNSSS